MGAKCLDELKAGLLALSHHSFGYHPVVDAVLNRVGHRNLPEIDFQSQVDDEALPGCALTLRASDRALRLDALDAQPAAGFQRHTATAKRAGSRSCVCLSPASGARLEGQPSNASTGAQPTSSYSRTAAPRLPSSHSIRSLTARGDVRR